MTGNNHPPADMDLQCAIDYLHECLLFLQTLTDEQYSKNSSLAFDGSIGKHYRHALDHYEQFLCGLDTNLIQYDLRQRDTAIETNLADAGKRTRDIILQLRKLPVARLDKGISCETLLSTLPDAPPSSAHTTVRRELMFIILHTVHHQSMIVAISREHGITVPESFGKAPSTLHYEKSLRQEV